MEPRDRPRDGRRHLWPLRQAGDLLPHRRRRLPRLRALPDGARAGAPDRRRSIAFAVDSVCRQSWIQQRRPAAAEEPAQARYARYLEDELVPFIRARCGDTDQRIAACGASIGAYNALNAACRRPDQFDLMIGLSGTYSHDHRMGGHFDDDYYFNMPLHFVPGLRGAGLEALRTVRFVFGLGEAYEHPPYTWAAASVLGRQGIWNRVEAWGPGSGHDWPTWRTMLPVFLDRLTR
ncbi:MAG: alpha/beta hydrolase-fold protein [Nannocystaceae bacterium]